MREKVDKPYAYHVACKKNKETIDFYVTLKSLKNNDNLCSHCPMRHKCRHRGEGYKVHFYAILRNYTKVRLPMEVTIL